MITIAPQFTQRAYNWTDWKVVQKIKGFVHQHEDEQQIYTIWGYDGPEAHVCMIYKGEVPQSTIDGQGYTQEQNDLDRVDFEENFKATSNQQILTESITRSEKNDKDKKISKAKISVEPGFVGHVFVKIPGTMNIDPDTGMPIESIENDRWINGGSLICSKSEYGDFIELDITANDDVENLIVVKSFTEVAEDNDEKNGWYINPILGSIYLSTPTPAHGYAGCYVHMIYHATSVGQTRSLFLNMDWDQKTP
jgi:hypothetical protein